jgi:hypothetical protein
MRSFTKYYYGDHRKEDDNMVMARSMHEEIRNPHRFFIGKP